MSNQIKYYSLNSLDGVTAEKGSIYFLSNGSQFIGTSSNTFLPISDFIFTDTLPPIGILDKIYVHKEADKTSLKIWSGIGFELLGGEEFDDSVIQEAITLLQNELSTLQGKVTAVETKVVTNEGKISTLETKVNELENQEVDLSPLQDEIDSLTTKTNDIESNVTTLDGKVTDLETEVASKGNVKSVNGNVADENGNVSITIDSVTPYDDTELRGKVTVNEGKISTLETKVEELENADVDLTPIQTQLDSHTNDSTGKKHIEVVTSIPTDLSESGILFKVDSSQPDVPSISTEDIINEKVAEIKDKIDDVEFKMKLANKIDLKFDGFVPAQNPYRYLQSICYIPSENALLVGYKNFDGTVDYLCDVVKFSLTDYSVIQTYKDLELYHINDMTFNENTNELVVSVLYAPEGKNVLYVYNYPSMTLKKKVTILSGTNVTANTFFPTIAYNADRNEYLSYNGTEVIFLTDDFTFIRKWRLQRYSNHTLQTMEYFNNLIYIYFDKLIWVYDLDGNRVREWFIDKYGESEGIVSLGNGEFLVGNIDMHNYTDSPKILRFNIYSGDSFDDWKIYSSLTDLGIKTGEETIEKIASAMANKTKFIFEKTSTNTSNIYPTVSGTLEVAKYNNTKVHFKFSNASSVDNADVYTGLFNVNLSTPWTGFKKLLNKDSVATEVYGSKASLTSGTDLNNITTEGIYITSSAAITTSLINKPALTLGAGARLTVTKGVASTITFQRLEIAIGGASSSRTYKEFKREYNGSWSDWTMVVHSLFGNGSPEGLVTAPIGSMYINTAGGASTTLYIKTSGTGNAGWTAK